MILYGSGVTPEGSCNDITLPRCLIRAITVQIGKLAN